MYEFMFTHQSYDDLTTHHGKLPAQYVSLNAEAVLLSLQGLFYLEIE